MHLMLPDRMLASVLSDDSCLGVLRCAVVHSVDYGTQGALQCTCDARDSLCTGAE
jgi:hypothetical protein